MNTSVPAQATRDAMSATALSSMLLAVGGLRNFQAAAAMVLPFLAALVIGWVTTTLMGQGVGSFALAFVLMLILAFVGVHAAGVLLMDQARNVPLRSLSNAWIYGLLCVPKTIGLFLLLLLVAVVLYAAIAVLFWICRLPGLGPILFAVVQPVSVVLAGLASIGFVVGLLLALAAIWEGASVFTALVRVLAVLQLRLMEALLLLMVLGFLVGILGSLIFAFLAVGSVLSLGLAAAILPGFIGGGGIRALLGGLGSGGGGYVIAGIFGSAVLAAVSTTILMLVTLSGVSLAYLRLTEGLDSSAAAGAMKDRLAEAKRKASELGAMAKEASEKAKAQAEQALAQQREAAAARAAAAQSAAADAAAARAAAAAGAAAAAAPMLSPPTGMPGATAHAIPASPAPGGAASAACPACGSAVTAADVFCGDCGHRLQPAA